MDHVPTEDPELEEFAIAEDELIDAYVRNELSADERKLIEKVLRNSPRLAERVRFANMLAKAAVDSVQPNPKPIIPPWWKLFIGFVERPAFRTALAACVVIVLVGGAAVLAGWIKLRNESQRVETERAALEQRRQELEKTTTEQQSRSNQLSAELQMEKEKREHDQKKIEELQRALNQTEQPGSLTTPSTFATILLFSGLTRGESGGNELIVSPGTVTVKLNLVLDSDEYPSYKVIIRNAQTIAAQRAGLKPRRSRSNQIITVQIPAKLLTPGDYTVRLSGVSSSGAIEPVADYAFRVTSKQQ
jgi:hypothetical protein